MIVGKRDAASWKECRMVEGAGIDFTYWSTDASNTLRAGGQLLFCALVVVNEANTH